MDCHSRRQFLAKLTWGTGAFAGVQSLARSLAAEGEVSGVASTGKPNIVFILADDMGWSDLSIYGSDLHKTPNIDRLAAQGMRFTNAYAASPVCSPTRASILAGQYPARLRLTDYIPGRTLVNQKLRIPEWRKYLPVKEPTIASELKRAGYATACFGKWHLQVGTPEDLTPYGFDTFDLQQTRGSEDPKSIGRLARLACDFIESRCEQPFFLYLAQFAVHLPIEARAETIEKYRARIKPGMRQTNPEYAAMVARLDEGVGEVLKTIDATGLAERTIVIFMSDNGGLEISGVTKITNNAPLRDGKMSLYEGGVREPHIVRWPGVCKPGSVCDEVVCSVDFYPTMLEMSGATATEGKTLDGLSIAPLLRGERTLGRDAVHWHFPHYQIGYTPAGSIREGDWKLIEYYENGEIELYNLKDDIGETTNLAEKEPARARALRDKRHKWLTSVKAQMPTPNPDYAPTRPSKVMGARQARKMKARMAKNSGARQNGADEE